MASEMTERNRRIVERFIAEGVLEGRLEVLTSTATPVSSTMPPHRRPARVSMLSSASSGSLVQPCRIRGGPTRSWVAHEEYVVVRAVRESTWSAGSFRGFATPQGVTWQLRWCIFGVGQREDRRALGRPR